MLFLFYCRFSPKNQGRTRHLMTNTFLGGMFQITVLYTPDFEEEYPTKSWSMDRDFIDLHVWDASSKPLGSLDRACHVMSGMHIPSKKLHKIEGCEVIWPQENV